jgi:hypothetical protein
MKLSLREHEAKIVSVNPRAELHGEDTKPACDVKIEVTLPNTELVQLHASLKSLLYVKDMDRPDLVSQADPEHATMLRFPQLGKPLKWDGEMIGASAVLHYGTSEKSHIKLEGCVVGDVRLEPLNGGSIVTTVRIQCHPDEKAMGRLCMMVGTKIPVTITPPEADGDVLTQTDDPKVLRERTQAGDVYA